MNVAVRHNAAPDITATVASRATALTTATMQAMVQSVYGPPDVLSLRTIARPTLGAADVLVRVHAAALHIGDSFGVRGAPLLMRMVTGLFRPKPGVPGFDLAGVVEAVGSGVATFRPGDAVFGASHGTCAEFASAPAAQLALKPTNLTFEQAAAVPTSALAALHGLRDAGGLQARTEGAHQRCGGRHRHVRGPDCQGIRRERHRRVQHAERGPCPFVGRRCRDRLHEGGFHPSGPAVPTCSSTTWRIARCRSAVAR